MSVSYQKMNIPHIHALTESLIVERLFNYFQVIQHSWILPSVKMWFILNVLYCTLNLSLIQHQQQYHFLNVINDGITHGHTEIKCQPLQTIHLGDDHCEVTVWLKYHLHYMWSVLAKWVGMLMTKLWARGIIWTSVLMLATWKNELPSE